MKIICLGDSLTYGFGVGRRKVWTALASEGTGHGVVNKGINGDTTGGMLARFTEDVVREAPDAVLLMGGSNDFIMGEPVSTVQANMSAMAYRALSLNILPVMGIQIDICPGMIRQDWAGFTDFQAVRNKTRAYREGLIRFCRTFNIRMIDFHGIFLQEAPEAGRAFYSDGLHLNEAGHRYLAGIFMEALAHEPLHRRGGATWKK